MTTRPTADQAFANAASLMVAARPVVDVLTALVQDAADVLDAQAVAILVTNAHGHFDLLASSSVSAGQLELLQAQDERGPCVDVVTTGRRTSVTGAEEMTERWGRVGRAMVARGLRSVDAVPLTWHDRTLGGLNVFYDRQPPPAQSADPAQTFADVATVALVHSVRVPEREVLDRVRRAVGSRDVLEQAKGALAELERIDLGRAADRLREIARSDGVSLRQAAHAVLARAAAPPTDTPR